MKLSRKIPLFLCLLIVGFASCKKSNDPSKNINRGKDLVLSPLDEQKVTADNAFTLKLFKNLDSANAGAGNLFVSPLSVSFALGMASNGSAGPTLDAFKNTLNFAGLTQAQVNSYYNNLITNLPQLDPNTTLDIGNSIWCKQGFNVLPQFLKTDSNNFHAKIQTLDFSNPSAVNTINSWVNSETRGNIPSIITQIPGDAVMYLVNAIYFKSKWAEKFDPAQTKTMPFILADNSQVQASFMTGAIDFNYYKDSRAVVFELPYSNSRFSMVIVMPAFGSGMSISDLMAGLNPAQWQTWMTNLQPTKNFITMPKFKFSYSANLKDPLIDLGLGIAFSDAADFSLINPGPPSLKITEVMHKAFVETDESGTTAAAATSVRVTETIAPAPVPAIDHPFLFAIREMSSGLIVFAGTVYNPLLAGN